MHKDELLGRLDEAIASSPSYQRGKVFARGVVYSIAGGFAYECRTFKRNDMVGVMVRYQSDINVPPEQRWSVQWFEQCTVETFFIHTRQALIANRKRKKS